MQRNTYGHESIPYDRPVPGAHLPGHRAAGELPARSVMWTLTWSAVRFSWQSSNAARAFYPAYGVRGPATRLGSTTTLLEPTRYSEDRRRVLLSGATKSRGLGRLVSATSSQSRALPSWVRNRTSLALPFTMT